MKYFSLITMAVLIVASIWYSAVIVNHFVSLPDTAMFWKDGAVAGWIQLVFFLIAFDGIMMFPIWLMWDSYKDLRKEK